MYGTRKYTSARGTDVGGTCRNGGEERVGDAELEAEIWILEIRLG